MRKHLHTALVILAIATQAQGQFSGVWTNGDLFAVNEMASQCYSASVERCVAVGVTPSSPSWFDYMLGKNHAKLASVKANIAAVRPYFVNPRTNALDLLKARNTAAWTNDAHFLNDCALPTNAISETPWFKSQYASTTGGWVHCWLMLTNITRSQTTAHSWPSNSIWYGASSEGSNSWAALVAESESDWAFESYFSAMPYSLWFGASVDGFAYQAAATHSYGDVLCTVASNAPERKTDSYYKGTAYPDDPYYAYDTNVFSAQGTGIDTNFVYVTTTTTNAISYTMLSTSVMDYADATTDPGIPPDTDADPSSIGPENWIKSTGYEVTGVTFIHDFTATTNGFKFR